NVATAVHSYTGRKTKPRVAPGPVRTPTTTCQPDEHRHSAGRRNSPDRVVVLIRYKDAFRTVHSNTARKIKPRVAPHPSRAPATPCEPCKCRHGCRRRDFPNRAIQRV